MHKLLNFKKNLKNRVFGLYPIWYRVARYAKSQKFYTRTRSQNLKNRISGIQLPDILGLDTEYPIPDIHFNNPRCEYASTLMENTLQAVRINYVMIIT